MKRIVKTLWVTLFLFFSIASASTSFATEQDKREQGKREKSKKKPSNIQQTEMTNMASSSTTHAPATDLEAGIRRAPRVSPRPAEIRATEGTGNKRFFLCLLTALCVAAGTGYTLTNQGVIHFNGGGGHGNSTTAPHFDFTNSGTSSISRSATTSRSPSRVVIQSATPTSSVTSVPSLSETLSASNSATATKSPTGSRSVSSSVLASASASVPPSASAAVSQGITSSPTASNSPTPSKSPSQTPAPTINDSASLPRRVTIPAEAMDVTAVAVKPAGLEGLLYDQVEVNTARLAAGTELNLENLESLARFQGLGGSLDSQVGSTFHSQVGNVELAPFKATDDVRRIAALHRSNGGTDSLLAKYRINDADFGFNRGMFLPAGNATEVWNAADPVVTAINTDRAATGNRAVQRSLTIDAAGVDAVRHEVATFPGIANSVQEALAADPANHRLILANYATPTDSGKKQIHVSSEKRISEYAAVCHSCEMTTKKQISPFLTDKNVNALANVNYLLGKEGKPAISHNDLTKMVAAEARTVGHAKEYNKIRQEYGDDGAQILGQLAKKLQSEGIESTKKVTQALRNMTAEKQLSKIKGSEIHDVARAIVRLMH